MQIQSINSYNIKKNTSFKATPIGLARNIIENALIRVAKNGDNVQVTTARNLIIDIANFGRYYHDGQPLTLTAKRLTPITGSRFYASSNPDTPFLNFNIKDEKDPMNVLTSIRNALFSMPKSDEIRANDAEMFSKNFMTQWFGKVEDIIS